MLAKDIAGHRIDIDRLLRRIEDLAQIGATDDGGVCRIALTEAERDGRDLVVHWMGELGLDVKVDQIGNVWGVREGRDQGPPIMIGSHIDTVATGGWYDGNLGVLAGLEVIEVLNDKGIQTRHPIAVGFFTNEEGARFTPDMMGSSVHQGSMSLEEALEQTDASGISVGQALEAIGYVGNHPVGQQRVRAFLELHIEQGPVLEREGLMIGAVTGVQGISWTEWTVTGSSNHAGTTPMSMRKDACVVAARLAVEARAIADELGGDQVATVGSLVLEPDMVNVIARRATVTVDLRNTDWTTLQSAERLMSERAHAIAASEGCGISSRSMARFEPVEFDREMVSLIETSAKELGYSVKRMPSGAGHDAQMFAPNCPSAMIFVPSKDGLSHNIKEYTAPHELQAGADILLRAVLSQAESV